MPNPHTSIDPAERWLAERVKVIESSGIRRVFDLGASLKNPINFSIGQPDFPPSERVREAAKRAIDDGWNRYTPTQGIEPLRRAVAEKLARLNGVQSPVDDVLITSGSSGGIFLALASILNPDDEIIIPDPYFVMYTQLTAFFGARAVLVDTYPDFQLDPDKVAAAVSARTKAILLNSPNNPTGAVYSEAALREVAEIAEKNGLLVISDEVYEFFVYDDAHHFSVGRVYPDTLTLNAFSKSHSLTGWRIGYAAGPRHLLEKMKELQQYTFVCAPSFAQVALVGTIDEGPTEYLPRFQARRDLVYDGLKNRFEVARPTGAFYIMPKVADSDATEFVDEAI
ncbi:MAG TPA: aminotransferase class I/II-fold pyridoxal phosphate-dependent enzyme, partial [Chloroflexota bacterium]|nr:aminotransferase class I/II-fold pyridoxal phosphate-dependent enzyme [Chloroflexota bacterium]